jgi:hypothetical protein
MDPEVEKKSGESNINALIRIENSYNPEVREMKQKIVFELNITHGYSSILFDYCKLILKKYTDIIRKWLGVKKRTYVKQVLREIEIVTDRRGINC